MLTNVGVKLFALLKHLSGTINLFHKNARYLASYSDNSWGVRYCEQFSDWD